MPAPVHPLVDGAGPGFVVSETRSRVVGLTQLRQYLFLRAAQARSRMLLVSDEQSRLTDPFRDVLVSSGGAWVVRSGDGDLRDGLSGRALTGIAEALTPPTRESRVAPRHLNLERPESVQLVVSASIRHRADDATRLGRAAEVLAALGGATTPRTWGTAEPCESPWDKDVLTAAVRDRMPAETRLLLAGDADHPMVASLSAARTGRGVEEVTTGLIAAGAPGSPEAQRALDAAPSLLAALCDDALPLVATVFTRVGRTDLTTRPFLRQDPEPVALLIGAPAVRELGLDVEALRARFGAVTAGRPRVPALVFALRDPADTLAGDPWRRTDALIGELGRDRVEALTGVRFGRPRGGPGAG